MEILRDYNNIPIMDITKEHLKNKRPFSEPILRPGSKDWSNFVDEVRNLVDYGFIKLDSDEKELIYSSLGEEAIYEGSKVFLEIPTILGTDPLSNTSLFEVYVSNGSSIQKVNFTNHNIDDEEHYNLINEMFYIIENKNILTESENKKDDRCTRIAKRKYDSWPSAYASGAVVRCRKGEIWVNIKETINEGFLTNRLSKFKDIPKIKSKTKLINLFKEYMESDFSNVNQKDQEFLNNFNIELLLLKELTKHEITKSDLNLIKLYSNNNDNFKQFENYINHPLKEVLDWDIDLEEKFDKEEKEGLHGWFSRNNGKGWIDCKKSTKGNLVPCGRDKSNGAYDEDYPACRPTLSACKNNEKQINSKNSKKRVDWDSTNEDIIDIEEKIKLNKKNYFYSIDSFPYYNNVNKNEYDEE